MLKVTDLQAGYAGSEVLQALAGGGDGESVVVLAPNGHGKTTLLRAISGLIRPTGGRVEFDGQDITHKRASTSSPRGSSTSRRVTCPSPS